MNLESTDLEETTEKQLLSDILSKLDTITQLLVNLLEDGVKTYEQ